MMDAKNALYSAGLKDGRQNERKRLMLALESMRTPTPIVCEEENKETLYHQIVGQGIRLERLAGLLEGLRERLENAEKRLEGLR